MVHIPEINTQIESDDQASIVCEVGKTLVITVEETKPVVRKKRPSWVAIGDGMQTKHFKSYPYEETLLDLSTPESKMLKLVIQHYNIHTGYSVVDLSKHTASEKNVLSSGYIKLKQRELVRRVKKGVYMINPSARINLNLFDSLHEAWQKLR